MVLGFRSQDKQGNGPRRVLRNLVSACCWISLTVGAWVWGGSLAVAVFAASIETEFIQAPWQGQRVREIEVGKYPVRWRQRILPKEAILAGVGFEAPLSREVVWKQATDYTDLGHMTPGVQSVRFLERQPHRQVLEIVVKVLWKTLPLIFEIEQDPPSVMRFRLVNETVGEYRGICIFEELPVGSLTPVPSKRTKIELSTYLKPARPVPLGLLLLVERVTFLRGVEEFLKTCETFSR